MEVLWMGLSIVAVICGGFLLMMAIVKGLLFISRGSSKGHLRSSWVPIQVYSGDDALDHPALRELAELRGRQED